MALQNQQQFLHKIKAAVVLTLCCILLIGGLLMVYNNTRMIGFGEESILPHLVFKTNGDIQLITREHVYSLAGATRHAAKEVLNRLLVAVPAPLRLLLSLTP